MSTQTQVPTDLAAKVAALQARLTDARRDRARKDHELDAARAGASAARDTLRAEFGVETADQARALLAQLETDLAAVVADLSARLDEMEQR